MRRRFLYCVSVWLLCAASAIGQDPITVERGAILGSTENLVSIGQGTGAKLFMRGEDESTPAILCTCNLEAKVYLWFLVAPNLELVPFTAAGNKVLWPQIVSGKHRVDVYAIQEDWSSQYASVFVDVNVGPGPEPPGPDPPQPVTKLFGLLLYEAYDLDEQPEVAKHVVSTRLRGMEKFEYQPLDKDSIPAGSNEETWMKYVIEKGWSFPVLLLIDQDGNLVKHASPSTVSDTISAVEGLLR